MGYVIPITAQRKRLVYFNNKLRLGGIMKVCTLSKETQEVLKDILIQIEHCRNRANENHDYPPSDYPFRPCQAIIAEKLGFEHRAEWNTDKYMGFIVKI